MPPRRPIPAARRHTDRRASMLLTALLFTLGLAIVLSSYLLLTRTALKTAHRTYFANDASNLAEMGLEEALYCFNLMAGGTATATAWSGWTTAGANAQRAFGPFSRDQNAIANVKVYVKGYNGTDTAPYILAQTTITPFDGNAPIVRTVYLVLSKTTNSPKHTLVGLNGVTITNGAFADGFNSSVAGLVFLSWTQLTATATASVVALSGAVDISSGYIFGDLYTGPGVTVTAPGNVSGTTVPNYSATFPFPTYPTAGSVSQSYNLGSTLPSSLPRLFDSPASDGRFYYFISNTTITNCSIKLLCNVSIIGTNTGMAGGVTLATTSSLYVYMDKPLDLTAGSVMNLLGDPTVLRIYTTTANQCTFGDGTQITSIFMAPNADLRATGTSITTLIDGFYLAKTVYASGTSYFHGDNWIPSQATATTYKPTRWLDLQSAADRAAVPGMSGNYLQ